jgi:hypothetical protein
LGKTNEQIVKIVFRTFRVKKLINKLIDNSSLTQTDSDLEQYIYLVLLNMDNEKLQVLYDRKELRKFISQIIKNQRNSGKFYNTLTLNFSELDGIEVEDGSEHNFRLDFVMDKIESITFFITGQTQLQLRRDMSISILYLYMIKGLPKWKICIDFKIGISTLNLLLRDAKNYLKKDYEQEFDEWMEKINKENDINNNFNDGGI